MAEFPSQGCLDLLEYLTDQGMDFQDFAASVGDGIGADFLAHLLRGRKRPSIQTAGDIERATSSNVLAVTWSARVTASKVQRSLASAKAAARKRRAAS
jgi:hypothetical protein